MCRSVADGPLRTATVFLQIQSSSTVTIPLRGVRLRTRRRSALSHVVAVFLLCGIITLSGFLAPAAAAQQVLRPASRSSKPQPRRRSILPLIRASSTSVMPLSERGDLIRVFLDLPDLDRSRGSRSLPRHRPGLVQLRSRFRPGDDGLPLV